MGNNFKILKIIFLFIKNEIKIFKDKIKYVYSFFIEINFCNLVYSKLTNINSNIFYIKEQNQFINLLKKNNLSTKKKIDIKKNKVFIESFINHPSYTIPNCYISKIVSDYKNYECYGILRSGDIKGQKIMSSFGIKKIHFINDGNIFNRVYYLILSFKILHKIKNIKDFNNLKIDKIQCGISAYEQYIRFKKDTDIQSIKDDFYILFAKALLLNKQFEKIYKNNRGSFLVQSETQFFPFRISFQVALKNKIKVISKRGISNTGIKIFQDFSEKNYGRYKIFPKFFNNYYNKYYLKNSKKVNTFFLNYKNKSIGKDVWKRPKKKINKTIIISSKKNICNHFNWKSNKPLVIIFAHELTDGNLVNKWNIFENDFFWLKETLQKISLIKNVNWIIKSHPSEDIFNAKIKTSNLFEKYCANQDNIKLLPKNFKIEYVDNICDYAITSHGSAGFEFPGLGIPTIICGDAPYSSLGFTVEPKTKKKYFEILKNIKKIKKNYSIIKKSRFYVFLFHYLCTVVNPIMHEADISMKYNKKEFWKKSLKILKNRKKFDKNFISSVEHQIKSGNEVLINLERNNEL